MEKEFVLPGQKLSDNFKQAGSGTYIKNGSVYSALCGLVVRKQKISVIPFSGPYMPSENDVVVGYVTAVTPSNWIFDIGSPYEAFLHATEYPIRVPSEKMGEYFTEGDVAILRVREVKQDGTIELTYKGDSAFKKLTRGDVIQISSRKISRVIGRSGSMVSMLKLKTGCEIFVGHNGRIWILGSAEDMKILTKALFEIEEKAHVSGLTDMMAAFIDKQYGVSDLLKSESSVETEEDSVTYNTNQEGLNTLDGEDSGRDLKQSSSPIIKKPRSSRVKSLKKNTQDIELDKDTENKEDVAEEDVKNEQYAKNKKHSGNEEDTSDRTGAADKGAIEDEYDRNGSSIQYMCVCFQDRYF